MAKKQALPIYLDDAERAKVEQRAKLWGTSLSAAIKRMIREHQD